MLLIVTNTLDPTADYLASVLEASNLAFLRLDTDTLTEHCLVSFDGVSPVLTFDGCEYLPDAISNVWYRRPERLKHHLFEDGPESRYALNEWTEAIEGFLSQIPLHRWMNHPSLNAAASHKIEQIITARRLGFKVPDTIVTQDPRLAETFFARSDGRVIVKPINTGYVTRSEPERDSVIYTNVVETKHFEHFESIAACPTLLQSLVSKVSDVRITVVDGAVHAVELVAREDGRQRCDIRRNNMEDVAYRSISLPDSVASRIQDLLRFYSLRFAAIDMVVAEDGTWYFLEINPNGQWAWLDLAGGQTIAKSFVTAFCKPEDPPR